MADNVQQAENADNVVVDEGNNVDFHPEWGVWPPPPPQAPPLLYNFQQRLAGQGLQVQHGILPMNNLQDSHASAWNDSISMPDSTDSSATISNSYVLVPVNIMNRLWPVNGEATSSAQETVTEPPQNQLEIALNISDRGMQLNMISHGNFIPAMTLNDCIPMLRFNTYLKAAIMPIIASFGPWSSGYGFKHAQVEFRFIISECEGGLNIETATQSI